MKKLILSAFMLLGLAFSAQAQDISKNALGLRLGDNDGFGGEISYQRGMGSNNRLEFDLGWRNSKHVDAFKLVGLYQWVWNIEGGFNWYAGVGAGVGSWNHKYRGPGNNEFKDSGTTTIEETALIQEQIRNVGKLVVTEGHFSEVLTYCSRNDCLGQQRVDSGEKLHLKIINYGKN